MTELERWVVRAESMSMQEFAQAVFPGGHSQVVTEGRALYKILGQELSQEECTLINSKVKTLLYQTDGKTFLRAKNFINARISTSLTLRQCLQIYHFAICSLRKGERGVESIAMSSLESCLKIASAFFLEMDFVFGRSGEVTLSIGEYQHPVILLGKGQANHLPVLGYLISEHLSHKYPQLFEQWIYGERYVMTYAESLNQSMTGLWRHYESSIPFSLKLSFYHELFGNRLAESMVWADAYEQTVSHIDNQKARDIYKALFASMRKIVDVNEDIYNLKRFDADKIVANHKALRHWTAWLLACYLLEQKKIAYHDKASNPLNCDAGYASDVIRLEGQLVQPSTSVKTRGQGINISDKAALTTDVLAEVSNSIPSKFHIYRTEPNTKNEMVATGRCVTIAIRSNFDTRDYFIVNAEKQIPQELIQKELMRIGPVTLWAQDVDKIPLLYYFDILSKPLVLWKLRTIGFAIVRNRMARTWEEYPKHAMQTMEWLNSEMASKDWNVEPVRDGSEEEY